MYKNQKHYQTFRPKQKMKMIEMVNCTKFNMVFKVHVTEAIIEALTSLTIEQNIILCLNTCEKHIFRDLSGMRAKLLKQTL